MVAVAVKKASRVSILFMMDALSPEYKKNKGH
jgi:hypothetical protein